MSRSLASCVRLRTAAKLQSCHGRLLVRLITLIGEGRSKFQRTAPGPHGAPWALGGSCYCQGGCPTDPMKGSPQRFRWNPRGSPMESQGFLLGLMGPRDPRGAGRPSGPLRGNRVIVQGCARGVRPDEFEQGRANKSGHRNSCARALAIFKAKFIPPMLPPIFFQGNS